MKKSSKISKRGFIILILAGILQFASLAIQQFVVQTEGKIREMQENIPELNNKYQNTDSFDNLWLQLMNKNSLKCANIIPSFWYAVDNVEQLDQLNLRFKKKQHVK